MENIILGENEVYLEIPMSYYAYWVSMHHSGPGSVNHLESDISQITC